MDGDALAEQALIAASRRSRKRTRRLSPLLRLDDDQPQLALLASRARGCP